MSDSSSPKTNRTARIVRAEIGSLVAPKNAKPARWVTFWQQYRDLYVELFEIDGTPQWVRDRILNRVDQSLRIARGQEPRPAAGLDAR